MDDKDNAVDTTTSQAPADVKPEEAKGDKASEEEQIDYKAELERVQKELGQAKHTIIDLKRKKGERDEDESEEDEEEDDAEETKQSATEEAEAVYARRRQEELAEEIDEMIEAATEDPDKRALIKLHYEKSITKTGFSRKAIARDIERAQLLADEKRVKNVLKEADKKLRSNDTKSTQAPADSVRQEAETEVKLTPAEEALLRRTAQTTGKSFDDLKKKI